MLYFTGIVHGLMKGWGFMNGVLNIMGWDCNGIGVV